MEGARPSVDPGRSAPSPLLKAASARGCFPNSHSSMLGIVPVTDLRPEELDMTLPQCPTCGTGQLLPISYGSQTFSYWVCSAPSCGYAISGNQTAVKFFKGKALQEERDKGEKKWTEFEF